MRQTLLPVVVLLGLCGSNFAAEPTPLKTRKEALQAVQDLIGSWRGTGEPQRGSREEKQKGFWTETIEWTWHFNGDDVCLVAVFGKSKYFVGGELRYVPAKDHYLFEVKTVSKESVAFEGELKNRRLVLERTDRARKETQRLTFNLLHPNRYVYRYEARPIDQVVFTAIYQVGATKEGVPFAGSDGKPVCIVSGGLGTSPVMYKGKTYYVCCSGCRDAFNEEPEKYIKEFEAKKAKKD